MDNAVFAKVSFSVGQQLYRHLRMVWLQRDRLEPEPNNNSRGMGAFVTIPLRGVGRPVWDVKAADSPRAPGDPASKPRPRVVVGLAVDHARGRNGMALPSLSQHKTKLLVIVCRKGIYTSLPRYTLPHAVPQLVLPRTVGLPSVHAEKAGWLKILCRAAVVLAIRLV